MEAFHEPFFTLGPLKEPYMNFKTLLDLPKCTVNKLMFLRGVILKMTSFLLIFNTNKKLLYDLNFLIYISTVMVSKMVYVI